MQGDKDFRWPHRATPNRKLLTDHEKHTAVSADTMTELSSFGAIHVLPDYF